MLNIHDLIEKWARWRIYKAGNDIGWPKRDSIGRALTGVPGTGCPTCIQKGRVDGKIIGVNLPFVICPTCGGDGRVLMKEKAVREITRECRSCEGEGEINGKTCIECRGIGETVKVHYKANPAYIHSTRGRDSYDDDPISQTIDYIVCIDLTELERSVLFLAFGSNGTQYDQAKKVRYTIKRKRGKDETKKGISRQHFGRMLNIAIDKIEQVLAIDTDEQLRA